MTDTPPAVANPPQFHPSYWDKIPRRAVPVIVHKVTTTEDGQWKEFTAKPLTGQMVRFRAKAEKVTQLVMPGAQASLEVIGEELITGLYLTDVQAWAFRMSSQDLADYTREVAGALHEQRTKARQAMLDTVAEAMLLGLDDLGLLPTVDDDEIRGEADLEAARHLALLAIGALESGPQQ